MTRDGSAEDLGRAPEEPPDEHRQEHEERRLYPNTVPRTARYSGPCQASRRSVAASCNMPFLRLIAHSRQNL